MSISSIKVHFTNPTQSEAAWVYSPGAGETRSVDGGFFFYGPSNSFDPTQPKLGFPNSARTTALPAGGFGSTYNPGVAAGAEYYFVCGVAFTDGSTEVSDVQKQSNAAPQGPAATEVSLGASSQEIGMGQSAQITVTALSATGPTAGREANFGFKTGSVRGTFAPPNPVLTNAQGEAVVTFTPLEPGNSHIESEVDGLSAGYKIKVKNA